MAKAEVCNTLITGSIPVGASNYAPIAQLDRALDYGSRG